MIKFLVLNPVYRCHFHEFVEWLCLVCIASKTQWVHCVFQESLTKIHLHRISHCFKLKLTSRIGSRWMSCASLDIKLWPTINTLGIVGMLFIMPLQTCKQSYVILDQSMFTNNPSKSKTVTQWKRTVVKSRTLIRCLNHFICMNYFCNI
jgi:hypothetical protein